MKILQVFHRYHEVGGSEEVGRQMSERLAKRGHEVYVLTTGTEPTEKNGVFIWPVKGKQHYLQELDYHTKRADILMVFGQKVWCSDWLPFSDVIHCPLVYIPVGFDCWGKGLRYWLYYKFWQKKICRMADALVALTGSEEEFLRGWIDHPNLVRIPLGVDYDYWQHEDNPEMLKFWYKDLPHRFMLSSGGYYNNKKMGELVRLLFFLKEAGEDIGLVTCGPDFKRNRKEVETYADVLGVQDRCRIYGEVPSSVLKDLYRECSIYISASTFEGFGLTFLEALACGKPVVCNPVGAAPELAEQTTNIFLTYDSFERTLAGVKCFLRYGHYADKSREVAKKYDWENILDKVEALYRSLA